MPKARVNDINIYYEVYGEGDPLLLIYGLGGRGNRFKFQIPAFSERFRTIIFDNRGVGETDQPEEAYSIPQMADDLIAPTVTWPVKLKCGGTQKRQALNLRAEILSLKLSTGFAGQRGAVKSRFLKKAIIRRPLSKRRITWG